MKHLLLLFIFKIISLASYAQVLPYMEIKNPSDGSYKNNPSVSIDIYKANIAVFGNVATTTVQMTFKNNTQEELEGKLTFPLPDGVSVSGFALDINGYMRKAVPIEKEKATEVYESIKRRKVDPGILERTEGNNFRTRVYPLPPMGTRTIAITYQQELKYLDPYNVQYYLPLPTSKLSLFELQVTVMDQVQAPALKENPDGDFTFVKNGNSWNAQMSKQNFTPQQSIHIGIPINSKDATTIIESVDAKNHFFATTIQVPKMGLSPKSKPITIGIIWDNSLSRTKANIQKEKDFLSQYLQWNKNVTIELATINLYFKRHKTIHILNGNTKELFQWIDQLTYDGGTDFSKLSDLKVKECFLFTDGFSNLGSVTKKYEYPVHSIISNPSADYNTLRYLSNNSKGTLLDLNVNTLAESVNKLKETSLFFVGLSMTKGLKEVYPSAQEVTGTHITVTGKMSQINTQTTAIFESQNGTRYMVPVSFSTANVTNSWNVASMWAQKKIMELEYHYEEHKKQISDLGKEYGIVTKNTSFIVLEDIEDYVKYEITPPGDLMAEYIARLAEKRVNHNAINESLIENAQVKMQELLLWWKEDNKKTGKRKVTGNDNNIEEPTSAPTPNVVVNQPQATQSIEAAPPTVSFTSPVVVSNKDSTNNENKEINNRPVSDITKALEGTSPGIHVIEGFPPGSASDIRIRGMGSENGNSAPIYVVDGVVYDGDIADINQEDLQNITILKDATATSIYGSRGSNGVVVITLKKDNISPNIDTTFGTFTEKLFNSNESYINEMSAIRDTDKAYKHYLKIRKAYSTTPSFYFNVANHFYGLDQAAIGNLVISNLAELELEDAEMYKSLLYILRKNEQYDKALIISHKILEWRPFDPQSHRDYALSLQDVGRYQEAVDALYAALTRAYTEETANRDDGIEETILMELNQMISRHGATLQVSQIDPALIHDIPVDIRVVLNWNMDQVDIDLHIIDPKGEECYYSNQSTKIGGRLSNDFRDGFGPEQYLLKKAIKGKYKIQTKYFRNDRASTSGPTTLMAEVYLYYGSGKEEKKIIVFESAKTDKSKSEDDKILIGEFES